jgi:hypothetical protein
MYQPEKKCFIYHVTLNGSVDKALAMPRFFHPDILLQDL